MAPDRMRLDLGHPSRVMAVCYGIAPLKTSPNRRVDLRHCVYKFTMGHIIFSTHHLGIGESST